MKSSWSAKIRIWGFRKKPRPAVRVPTVSFYLKKNTWPSFPKKIEGKDLRLIHMSWTWFHDDNVNGLLSVFLQYCYCPQTLNLCNLNQHYEVKLFAVNMRWLKSGFLTQFNGLPRQTRFMGCLSKYFGKLKENSPSHVTSKILSATVTTSTLLESFCAFWTLIQFF